MSNYNKTLYMEGDDVVRCHEELNVHNFKLRKLINFHYICLKTKILTDVCYTIVHRIQAKEPLKIECY